MQPESRSETTMRLAFKAAIENAPDTPLRGMISAKLRAGIGLAKSGKWRVSRP